MLKPWKEEKLNFMEEYYGRYLPKCEGHDDDRALYVRIYSLITEALRSLPDELNLYVRRAMGNMITKDTSRLDEIIKTFWS